MSGPAPFDVRHDARLAWQPWGRAAFEAARAADRLVLLLVTMPWCAACAALESAEFTRDDIVRLVQRHFVPIHVNGAARPDISERYLADGWPTVACLTAAGYPLTASSPTSRDELASLLTRAVEGFNAHRAELRQGPAPKMTSRVFFADSSGKKTPDVIFDVDWLRAQAIDAYDPVYAGFGEGAKIPHAPLLELLLIACDSDVRCRTIVMNTLDAMGDRLRDRVTGGFFRATRRRDWSDPDEAKPIEVQAELIELFAAAGRALDEPRYLDAAMDTVRFANDVMALPSGGFSIDGALYVDANARMAKAYLRAGALLEERPLIESGVSTLERIMVEAYRPGAGVSHEASGNAATRGLLTDQIAAALALTESAAQAGIVPHLMLAEELMLYAGRVMGVGPDAAGGLCDRAAQPDDIGLLTELVVPFGLNCDAARVWLRLAALAERPEYRVRALSTLASQRQRVEGHGLFAAPYALAVAELHESGAHSDAPPEPDS